MIGHEYFCTECKYHAPGKKRHLNSNSTQTTHHTIATAVQNGHQICIAASVRSFDPNVLPVCVIYSRRIGCAKALCHAKVCKRHAVNQLIRFTFFFTYAFLFILYSLDS